MTTDASITPSIRHVIGHDGRFVLSMQHGDVRIRGIDGDVVHVRCEDGEGLRSLAVERDDHGLAIRAGSVDLVIEVPSGAQVVIEGQSPDVDVEGLTGAQRFRTGSGDLRLRDVRGNISAEAVSGDVDLVSDGTIQLVVRTVSGDVAARAASFTGLRATTTSGDLRIGGRFDGGGPYEIETVSGDVAIVPSGPVRVDLRTLAGDIRSDVPARTEDGSGRRSVVVGTGGPTVAVRSTSGDVRIVAAGIVGPALPPAPAIPPGPTAPMRLPEPTADPELEVLQALERGEIAIDEARRQLEALDHA